MNKKKLKYYCKNCNKKIHYTTSLYGTGICKSCAMKTRTGENNNNFKTGEFCKKHYCKDCGKEISYLAKRCKSCARIYQYATRPETIPIRPKGKDSHFFKHGETLKQHYCKCGKEITYQNALYGSGKCLSCVNEQRRKDSINHCECGNEIARRSKRCRECEDKHHSIIISGENNYNFGKHMSECTKQKLSLSHGGTGTPYEFSDYPSEFTEFLKESIRYRDGHLCQYCGKTEVQEIKDFNKVLAIHHIDYNKKYCNEENLITLCLSCHQKTNFNRDYWYSFYTYKIQAMFSLI